MMGYADLPRQHDRQFSYQPGNLQELRQDKSIPAVIIASVIDSSIGWHKLVVYHEVYHKVQLLFLIRAADKSQTGLKTS